MKVLGLLSSMLIPLLPAIADGAAPRTFHFIPAESQEASLSDGKAAVAAQGTAAVVAVRVWQDGSRAWVQAVVENRSDAPITLVDNCLVASANGKSLKVYRLEDLSRELRRQASADDGLGAGTARADSMASNSYSVGSSGGSVALPGELGGGGGRGGAPASNQQTAAERASAMRQTQRAQQQLEQMMLKPGVIAPGMRLSGHLQMNLPPRKTKTSPPTQLELTVGTDRFVFALAED